MSETHNYIKTPDHVVVAQGDAEYLMILDKRAKDKEFNKFRSDIQSCLSGLSELRELVVAQAHDFNARLQAFEGSHAS